MWNGGTVGVIPEPMMPHTVYVPLSNYVRNTTKTPYLLFIDLIKAFDTANHDLIFAILDKYGTPRALIDIIRRLHDNFQLKLVFDKKNQAIINYTVGVQQGDNMAGLLFLFLMQAMDE
jgi:hypothetical protein